MASLLGGRASHIKHTKSANPEMLRGTKARIPMTTRTKEEKAETTMMESRKNSVRRLKQRTLS